MTDPAEIVSSSMLGGLQPIRLPRARHERAQRPWWEAGRLCATRSLINEGDVVVEVGAEQGDFATLYALWGARVICVEPNDLAWPAVRLTMEANGVMPIACFNGFCADDYNPDNPGLVNFGSWPSATGYDYDPATGFRSIAESPELPSICLDQLAAMTEIPKVVCVDVEGAEAVVLRGAEHLLRNSRPCVIVSRHPDEWMGQYGDTWNGLLSWMLGFGYDAEVITSDPHETHVLFSHPEGPT